MIHITTRVRKDRINKKGETRILAVLFDGKKTKEISTGIAVKPDNWNSEKQRVSLRDASYQMKNSSLTKFLSDLQAKVEKQVILGHSVSFKNVVSDLQGDDTIDPYFIDYIDTHIKANPDDLSEYTIMYYKTCKDRIKAFKPKIKMSEIDSTFLSQFEKHLKKEYGNSQNTVFNRLKVIRKLCHQARKKGLMKHNPFEFYKIKTDDTKRDFITVDEINAFNSLNNLTESQELIRDVYIFSAMTGGLRFGDICTLSKSDLENRNKEEYIRLRMTKTDDYVIFKLPTKSLELINKYKGKGIGEYLFPILPEVATVENRRVLIARRNVYFNKVLKTLAKKANVDKHITFHTARHSFATISLTNGVQTEVVGKIMGHKDLKTTQIYTNILDSRKDEAIDKLNNIFEMQFLYSRQLNNFQNWLYKWNKGYPVTKDIYGFEHFEKYAFEYKKYKDAILSEIQQNLDVIKDKSDFDKYKEFVFNYIDKIQDWLDNQALTEAEFVDYLDPKIKDFIGTNVDLNHYHTKDHYYEFKSYNKRLKKNILTIFNNISPYIVSDEIKSEAISIYVPELKSAHLYILMHAIDRILDEKNKMPKTHIAKILSQTFQKKDGKNFSDGGIIKIKENNPTDTEINDVVNVLNKLAEIINDEYESRDEGDYFKSTD